MTSGECSFEGGGMSSRVREGGLKGTWMLTGVVESLNVWSSYTSL